MTANKINEVLGEIIHTASVAELADDEAAKVKALADVERLARRASPTDAGRAPLPRAKRGFINAGKVSALSLAVRHHKITAHVGESDDGIWEGHIFCDGERVGIFASNTRGKGYVETVVRHAMSGVASRCNKHARLRANRKMKEGLQDEGLQG